MSMLKKQPLKSKPVCKVTFMLPESVKAESAYLVGDFNNWDEKATEMKKLKKHLPKGGKRSGPGRPRVQNRNVINGIWYILWCGCQWKAVKQEWFQV